MIYAKISRAGSAVVIAPILEASWPQEEPACALYPAFFGGINGPAGGGHFLFFFLSFFFCLSYTDILEFLYPSQFTVLLRLFFFLAAFFDLLSTLWRRRVYIWRIKMIREFSRSNLAIESRSLRSKR